MNDRPAPETDVDSFIDRWAQSGAAERANFQGFAYELCDLLDVERPTPAGPDVSQNAYVFERPITFHHGDGTTSTGFIDLYRRGSFVLEAKQGSDPTDALGPSELRAEPTRTRRGTAVRGTRHWDSAMQRARSQADRYARELPVDEGWPPFLIVVDVGHCIELYSDFTRSGKVYVPFPDPRNFRIAHTDLSDPETRERLKLVWTDPMALDPTRRSARVTREVAARLADLAKSLEAAGHAPRAVADFLMRCLFTMFAEDIGLLPERAFTDLLEGLHGQTDKAPHLLRGLWQEMNTGTEFSLVLEQKLLKFNGGLFETPDALPLNDAQLELLIEAARADWRDVEPAIFGTLLERALDRVERHKLGAHYTPRAYVERLVMPTVIEPLRADWSNVLTAAAQLHHQNKDKEARDSIKAFHHKLCETRVLDPACGSGNFLYVTLEHMKRLEGEVLNALEEFGDTEPTLALRGHTVDPHQFLGIEINPRAASIAEMVLWIGFLQWHVRTFGTADPPQPVLRKFHNIEHRDAVLVWDRKELVRDERGKPVSRWDGRTYKKHPVTGDDVPDETAQMEVEHYLNPQPTNWPGADFIVGNPPFIGGKDIRAELGDGYVEAL